MNRSKWSRRVYRVGKCRCLFWASMTVTWEEGKGFVHPGTRHWAWRLKQSYDSDEIKAWVACPSNISSMAAAWGSSLTWMCCAIDRSISVSFTLTHTVTHMHKPHTAIMLPVILRFPLCLLQPFWTSKQSTACDRGLCWESQNLFPDATNSQCSWSLGVDYCALRYRLRSIFRTRSTKGSLMDRWTQHGSSQDETTRMSCKLNDFCWNEFVN